MKGEGQRNLIALGGDLAAATRNVCAMHTLERIAHAFNRARVPLLALKGAALNLTLYQRPEDRPMSDLDLLVRSEHVNKAFRLLGRLGAQRGESLVTDDFFPRFYAEVEFRLGEIYPVRIDLHVRPFRPLRYSRLVPMDALWQWAEPVRIGRATVLVPCAEEMLIHLAAHSALHGNVRSTWLRDIKHWADARRAEIDWDRFLETVARWGVTLPVRDGLRQAETDFGRICPSEVMGRLSRLRVSWRDRIALFQAPRDATHPVAHVATDVLCTPGWRFKLAYVRAMAIPGQDHMAGWYGRQHWGWLPCAHVLRLIWPAIARCRGMACGPRYSRETG